MITAYPTFHLLFKAYPHIKDAQPGISRVLGGFCVEAQATVVRDKEFKTYYLHPDGLWRRSLWRDGYFENEETAQKALEKVAAEIQLHG